jgi:hypothetical protein
MAGERDGLDVGEWRKMLLLLLLFREGLKFSISLLTADELMKQPLSAYEKRKQLLETDWKRGEMVTARLYIGFGMRGNIDVFKMQCGRVD